MFRQARQFSRIPLTAHLNLIVATPIATGIAPISQNPVQRPGGYCQPSTRVLHLMHGHLRADLILVPRLAAELARVFADHREQARRLNEKPSRNLL